MTNETETKITEHRVFEGIKPVDLQPGDLILKVDKRADQSLCCLTVYRKADH